MLYRNNKQSRAVLLLRRPFTTAACTTTLLLLFALNCLFQSAYAQSCPLCLQGSFDSELTIDGSTCQNIASTFAVESDATRCSVIQATYGVYCGCDNSLLDTACRVCGDSLLPNPELSIPPPSEDTAFDSCILLEFAANLNPNVDGELSCENVQTSEAASLCCTASSRPTRSPVAIDTPTRQPIQAPTRPPTRAPTFVPTRRPTITPSRSPTSGPSVSPTTRPTAGATIVPTTSPSRAATSPPTSLPTSQPSMRPSLRPVLTSPTSITTTTSPTATDSTPTPTAVPTSGPVQFPSTVPTDVPLIQVGASFTGIQLTLSNVGELSPTTQDNFESALQGWTLQTLRALRQFQTRVLYAGQLVNETSGDTVVTYDQTVSFVQPVTADPIDPRNVLLDPFENDKAVRQLLVRLQASDPIFSTLEGDTFESPIVPLPPDNNRNDNDDDDSKIGLIVGIVLGGLVLVGILMYFGLRSSGKDDKDQVDEEINEISAVHAPMESNKEDVVEVDAEEHKAQPEKEEESSEELEFSTEPSTLPSVPQPQKEDNSDSEPTVENEFSRSGPIEEDDTPTVSSAGGAISHKSNKSTISCKSNKSNDGDSSWMGVLGLESSDAQQQQDSEESREETFEVSVPPGKLGVVIDTPTEGPPTVYAVKNTSPLFGKLQVGDCLIQVDDEDVSSFSAVRVSKLIGRKAKNPERKFVMTRTLPFQAANAGQ